MKTFKIIAIIEGVLIIAVVAGYFTITGIKNGWFDVKHGDESVVETSYDSEGISEKESKVERSLEDENVKSNEETVEEASDENEITDEDLINDYYSKIASQDLENAYKMRADNEDVSFAKFKGWYGNVLSAEVLDIVKKAEHTYQYTVYLKEKGDLEEKYLVTMEIKDEFLDTVSSEKTWSNTDVEVYTEMIDGIRKIHVKKGEIDRLVATVDENKIYLGEKYIGYKISADKKYLMYTLEGVEWRNVHVYDIDNGQELYISYTPDDYGFTKDGKWFYECGGGNEFKGGGKFGLLSVPQFNTVFASSLNEGQYFLRTCKGYDGVANTYSYAFGDWYNDYYTRVYNVGTGVVQ